MPRRPTTLADAIAACGSDYKGRSMKVPARIVRNAPMTLAGVIAACGSDYKGRLMKVSAVLCAMPRLLMTLAGAIAACGSDY